MWRMHKNIGVETCSVLDDILIGEEMFVPTNLPKMRLRMKYQLSSSEFEGSDNEVQIYAK